MVVDVIDIVRIGYKLPKINERPRRAYLVEKNWKTMAMLWWWIST